MFLKASVTVMSKKRMGNFGFYPGRHGMEADFNEFVAAALETAARNDSPRPENPALEVSSIDHTGDSQNQGDDRTQAEAPE